MENRQIRPKAFDDSEFLRNGGIYLGRRKPKRPPPPEPVRAEAFQGGSSLLMLPAPPPKRPAKFRLTHRKGSLWNWMAEP